MTQVKVKLADAMETSLITLYGKAIDSESARPVLGDRMARSVVDRIDYDWGKLKFAERAAPNAAVRTRHFDRWTLDFLAQHPRSTVVHLGAGLDARAWRVNPGPEVAWFDVDQAGVIDARRKLFPERENYRLVTASVAEDGWLEQIPADRPTLVVAEGLFMYLDREQGVELVRRITGRFPSGVLTFDTQSPLAVRMVNPKLASTFGAPLLRRGISDPGELERAVPGLRRTDRLGALSGPAGVSELTPAMRVFAMVGNHIPALRNLSLYLRFEFG